MAKIEASLGPVSSGSLRQSDLLRAFAKELEALAERSDRSDHQQLVREAHFYLEEEELLADAPSADMLLIDLTDALQDYAPEGAYFGAAEGDGACFGFWKDEEGTANG